MLKIKPSNQQQLIFYNFLSYLVNFREERKRSSQICGCVLKQNREVGTTTVHWTSNVLLGQKKHERDLFIEYAMQKYVHSTSINHHKSKNLAIFQIFFDKICFYNAEDIFTSKWIIFASGPVLSFLVKSDLNCGQTAMLNL